MKLSVLLPSIRVGNIKRLYESIQKSTKEEFELIVVGPYDLPFTVRDIKNIKYIKDFGSPVRAQQIALNNACGEWIAWASDDGYFLPGTLEIAFSLVENSKSVIIGKYFEGNHSKDMEDIHYYYIYTHDASRCPFVPKNCLMLMEGIVSREIAYELGGWDAQSFEVLPMAFNDFSIRLYNYGCQFKFQSEPMFKCGHMPGTEGDHGPIHNAQTFYDLPRFKLIYSKESSKQRIKIPLDNWKNTPEVWERRFKK